MTQPVFLFVEATPNPDEKTSLQAYLTQAPVITKAHGGVPVATYDIETVLDGGEKPAVYAVVSFPDREAIKNLFNDPDFEALAPLRERGFSHIRYFIANERV